MFNESLGSITGGVFLYQRTLDVVSDSKVTTLGDTTTWFKG